MRRRTPAALRQFRRTHLSFDVLEDRLPVSEGVGPFLTVSALNTAAQLAHTALRAPSQPVQPYQAVNAAGAPTLAASVVSTTGNPPPAPQPTTVSGQAGSDAVPWQQATAPFIIASLTPAPDALWESLGSAFVSDFSTPG